MTYLIPFNKITKYKVAIVFITVGFLIGCSNNDDTNKPGTVSLIETKSEVNIHSYAILTHNKNTAVPFKIFKYIPVDKEHEDELLLEINTEHETVFKKKYPLEKEENRILMGQLENYDPEKTFFIGLATSTSYMEDWIDLSEIPKVGFFTNYSMEFQKMKEKRIKEDGITELFSYAYKDQKSDDLKFEITVSIKRGAK